MRTQRKPLPRRMGRKPLAPTVRSQRSSLRLRPSWASGGKMHSAHTPATEKMRSGSLWRRQRKQRPRGGGAATAQQLRSP